MAFLVAFEGIDGSGKGTQAGRLHGRLVRSGIDSALLSFPRYEATLFGKAIGDFLNGRFGSLEAVSPFLASLLYAGDRFESRGLLFEALGDNDVVILDRYVPSNIAHQGSKTTGDERQELIQWIKTVEYEIFELPSPDLVFLLDLPVSEAQQLIAVKQARSYTDKKADLQEANSVYLEGVRQVYFELARRASNWYKVECFAAETLRTIEEIGEEIWNVLQARHPIPE